MAATWARSCVARIATPSLIRLTRTPRGFWLDMRGTRSFFVRPPD